MGRESLTSIPTIDMEDFDAAGVRREEFTSTTMAAMHDIGFAFLRTPDYINEGLPRMYRVLEKLFDLPEDVKAGYERKDIHHQRGYTPLGTETGIQCRAIGPGGSDIPNFAENWFIGPDFAPDSPQVINYPAFNAPNIWPEEVPELEEAIKPVYDGLYLMGRTVLRALEKPLDKEYGFFDDLVDGSPTSFRPLHYPSVSEIDAPNTIGACQHTDINLLTVLPAPTREGLWVKTRAGLWVSGKAPKGYLIVQVGDMLQRITGGHFLSAQHKVKAPLMQTVEDKGRYSSALFVHAASDAPLEVIEKLTDNPDDFPTISAAEFLIQRLREIGLANI
jgi:isopenicillin N synthase-like dioxygenase